MSRREDKERVYVAVKSYFNKKHKPVPAIYFKKLGVETVILKLLVREGLLEECLVKDHGTSYRAYSPRGSSSGIIHPTGGDIIRVR